MQLYQTKCQVYSTSFHGASEERPTVNNRFWSVLWLALRYIVNITTQGCSSHSQSKIFDYSPFICYIIWSFQPPLLRLVVELILISGVTEAMMMQAETETQTQGCNDVPRNKKSSTCMDMNSRTMWPPRITTSMCWEFKYLSPPKKSGSWKRCLRKKMGVLPESSMNYTYHEVSRRPDRENTQI